MVLSSSIPARTPYGSNKHSERRVPRPSPWQSEELQWLIKYLRHAPPEDFAPEMVQVIQNTRASKEQFRELVENLVASLPELALQICGCFPGESEEWYTHFTVWFMACRLFGNDIEYPFVPPLKYITPKNVYTAKCAKEFLRVAYTDYEPERRHNKLVKPVDREARLMKYPPMEAPQNYPSGSEYEILKLQRELAKKNEEIVALKEEVKRKKKHVSTLLEALHKVTQ
ncbi:hypothetical protein HYFRA_00012456 [Hymenoscyphus fraxineus]|uniref:Uncharacterized protein n=1 Tax=Hymenoscyphus fraxineus TaxID=746836 RepID=A0A9N9PUL1_9HELO|nr:hypothetical protein HYFRA_00012456 [Hymenoscyphus fraxineus]